MCTQDGFFPLFIASQLGHDMIVEMLLQAGATVDLQNEVEDCYYLFICLLCCAMHIIHCTLNTTQHLEGNMNVRKQKTLSNTADKIRESNHLCTGSIIFSVWSAWDMFCQEISTENACLGSTLQ